MNWDSVFDALIKVVVLAFLIERALAVIFDMEKLEPILKDWDLKPIVAIIVSIVACFGLQLDALSPLRADTTSTATDLGRIGYFLTGLVVAGGSAGAVKLFQDVLGFRRSSRDELKALKAARHEAEFNEAVARVEIAKAEISDARAVQASASARVAAGAYTASSPEQQILIARMADRDLKLLRGE